MKPEFDRLLDCYVEVALRSALDFRPGQRLSIGSYGTPTPLEAAPFVSRIAARAYQLGAPLVDVIWEDAELERIRLQYAAEDTLTEIAPWKMQATLETIQRGDARIRFYNPNPDLLKNQDPRRIDRLNKAFFKHAEPILALNPAWASPWMVISVPTPSWNRLVFPDLDPQTQEERMWELIFELCRLKDPDPVAAWNAHLNHLAARSSYLNERHYSALRYTAPNIDLTVSLPAGHVWKGGREESKLGILFNPNIPTEEVYTLPDKDRVEGRLVTTKPFRFDAGWIREACLEFEAGKVVRFSAAEGEDSLGRLLDFDEGARRLGEAALVPHSSPISRYGASLNNELYDENSACHLALGRSYTFNLQGGEKMTPEQRLAAGANHSLIHVDFMIGSAEINVDGVTTGGAVEPILCGGEWAIE